MRTRRWESPHLGIRVAGAAAEAAVRSRDCCCCFSFHTSQDALLTLDWLAGAGALRHCGTDFSSSRQRRSQGVGPSRILRSYLIRRLYLSEVDRCAREGEIDGR